MAAVINSETLETAFDSFNHQSSLLEVSYRELQHKVQQLTVALADANTERHRELLEKERLGSRVAQLFEALPGAIIVIDGDGIIRERNSGSSELLNRPLLGCVWSEIVQREFCPGESANGELKLKDGRILSLSRRPLDSEPGEILLLTDVSESRRMLELLQRHQRLSSIGEMTASLAHQIRTPLTSALLYASQLKDSEQGAAQRQTVTDRIVSRLHDLGGMVDDMLGFASGSRKCGDAIVVKELLLDVADLFEPQLDGTSMLSVCVEDESILVEGNRPALKGALLNLLSNSMQAAGAPVKIQLGAVITDKRVYLTVTDNGDGISEEVLPRLFEPFFTTRPQGTGLGLAVVRSVAEAHHGEVLVDSGPNGTMFAICLPPLLKETVMPGRQRIGPGRSGQSEQPGCHHA